MQHQVTVTIDGSPKLLTRIFFINKWKKKIHPECALALRTTINFFFLRMTDYMRSCQVTEAIMTSCNRAQHSWHPANADRTLSIFQLFMRTLIIVPVIITNFSVMKKLYQCGWTHFRLFFRLPSFCTNRDNTKGIWLRSTIRQSKMVKERN